MLVSLPLPCTQWHNGDLLLVRGPLAWSGQRWEEGSVASIGGTNGQLGHRGRRITGHCHWSTRVQTLHRSLHQEPSRILIASGLPYMKLLACLLDLPPRMHSTTHDLWQGVTMSRVRAEVETPELEMRMLAPAWSTNTATSATRRPVTITLHQTCSCGHCFHTISHCGRGVGTLTRGGPAACVARWVIRYLVSIDCTCLAPPRTLYRKSMTICEIEVSCPVSSAAAAVELPHR